MKNGFYCTRKQKIQPPTYCTVNCHFCAHVSPLNVNSNPWEVKNTQRAEMKCEISPSWWDSAWWVPVRGISGSAWGHHKGLLWRCWGFPAPETAPDSPARDGLQHLLWAAWTVFYHPHKQPLVSISSSRRLGIYSALSGKCPQGFLWTPHLRNLVGDTSLAQVRKEKQLSVTALGAEMIILKGL